MSYKYSSVLQQRPNNLLLLAEQRLISAPNTESNISNKIYLHAFIKYHQNQLLIKMLLELLVSCSERFICVTENHRL